MKKVSMIGLILMVLIAMSACAKSNNASQFYKVPRSYGYMKMSSI